MTKYLVSFPIAAMKVPGGELEGGEHAGVELERRLAF